MTHATPHYFPICHPALFPLSEIPSPPEGLFLLGNENSLHGPRVAMVGTRNPSSYGLRAAHRIARELALRGVTVVSGLAYGIDTMAHRSALQAGGKTLAVLGHGLDRVYPRANTELAGEIQRNGCLLSEYPVGVAPLPFHFPQRNRIIAGLCSGVVVVEAAEKSGSLITARWALEQNREVFVVPGPFDSNGFSGSHRLLQEGAKLVGCAEDIFQELPPASPSLGASPSYGEWAKRFESFGGQATLDQLWSTDESLETFLVAIREARCRGWVMELTPQVFLWTGEMSDRLTHSDE